MALRPAANVRARRYRAVTKGGSGQPRDATPYGAGAVQGGYAVSPKWAFGTRLATSWTWPGICDSGSHSLFAQSCVAQNVLWRKIRTKTIAPVASRASLPTVIGEAIAPRACSGFLSASGRRPKRHDLQPRDLSPSASVLRKELASRPRRSQRSAGDCAQWE